MRKLIKWLGGAIFLIVLILVLTPYLFKGRLVEAAKQGLNENLRAKSDFKDVSVSFFRSFPHLQVTLIDLTIDGIDDFEGVPLFHAKSVSAAVNFWSVISREKPVEIVSLSADAPLVNILTLADGKANYDITNATDEESSQSGGTIQLQLNDYSFADGSLRYEDRTMPMTLALDNFNHRGVGRFADMQFDLETFTEVDWFSFNYDGVTYLDSTKAKLDAVLSIDLDEYRYTLKDNQLFLNDLELNGEGFIDLNDDDIELDLALTAPKSDFRQLFSILPGAYSKGFQQADIKGTFDLANRIWGRYSDEQYPAFTLKTTISDGSVKYPDLPVGISNINLDLAIDKPDGALDLMKILLSELALQIGPQPIRGHLAISTPVSDPNVEGSLQGILNLSDLAKAYPMQDMQSLEGKIDADIKFKARMSQIDQKKYDQVMIAGVLTAENLSAQMTGKPPVRISRTKLDFSPQSVKLSETSIQAGKSDLTIEGTLDNILALISPEKTLQGRVRMRSDLLDLDEWSSPGTEAPKAETVSRPAAGAPATIPAYDLDLDLIAKQVIVNGEKIDNPVLSGRIKPDQVVIRELSASTKGSDLKMQGNLQNLSEYMAGQGTLKGDIQIQSKKLDLNPFMGAPVSNPDDTSSLSPFVIPDNLDLKIDTRIEEFVYTDMSFKNVKGQILVADNTATLQDCSSEAFGGRFQLAGGYQTLAGQQPNFDLKYDMTDVQFSQIAQKFSYIKILAPIIKFLDGRFSTSFITNGALKDNFMPDLNSLNLSGLVETSECLLKSFGPAEELAEKLKLKFLQSPRIQNSKNWLEVKNGIVEIKEFDSKIEDIDFQISGTQSLSHELNYLIKMKIPRKYLEATELTKGLNEQFSWLTSEANKLGFKLSTGEFVNVNVIMNGTITKPTFDLKLVGMDGEKPLVDVVKDEVKQGVEHIIDSAKTVAEAKRDSLIKKGEEKVDKVVDTLAKEAQKVVDTLTNRATEEIKNKVDDELSKKASEVIDQKVGEVGGEKAKEEVDKVVDKLKSWKPFEKKKTTPPDTTKTETKKEE